MNAKHLIAALLSSALLVGCSDAGPLEPPHPAEGAINLDIDPPHPPILVEDPPMPLPNPGDNENERSGGGRAATKLEPVYPMPPIDDGAPKDDRPGNQDPPYPLPPAEK